MRYFTLILIGIAILSLQNSCTKKPNHTIDKQLKADYSFKVGSYWIYVDSISAKVDSFYVKLNRLDNEKALSNEYTYDYLSTIIQPYSSVDFPDSNLFSIQIHEKVLNFRYIVSVPPSGPGGIGPSYATIDYPFTNRDNNDYSSTIFTWFHVINNDFQNTVKIFFKSDNDTYYFAPGIGIVKMDIQDKFSTKRVWKLLRWYIQL